MRTVRCLGIDLLDEQDGCLSVENNDKFALDAMLLQSFPNQTRVGGVVLYKEDRNWILPGSRLARLFYTGL